jgi:hypothetical protein
MLKGGLEMNSKRTGVYAIAMIIAGLAVLAEAQPTDEQVNQQYRQQIERLDKVNFHPNLLPLILKHKDYLELTPQQIEAFRGWRKTNAKAMFATMDEIIRKRIEFREAALSPGVSANELRQKQQEIFALHQKVLDYKLSCRENIHNTFTEQNWDDFFVVLAEEGYAIPESTTGLEGILISGVGD